MDGISAAALLHQVPAGPLCAGQMGTSLLTVGLQGPLVGMALCSPGPPAALCPPDIDGTGVVEGPADGQLYGTAAMLQKEHWDCLEKVIWGLLGSRALLRDGGPLEWDFQGPAAMLGQISPGTGLCFPGSLPALAVRGPHSCRVVPGSAFVCALLAFGCERAQSRGVSRCKPRAESKSRVWLGPPSLGRC